MPRVRHPPKRGIRSTMTDVPDKSLAETIRELRQLQEQFFSHAQTYTKLVLGLGYGGFFAGWSGAKSYLTPRCVLWSILLITVSLLLFILYEVAQSCVLSILSLQFAGNQLDTHEQIIQAQNRLKSGSMSARKVLVPIWVVTFPTCVLTGLVGAGILIYGFITAIYRMY
jgi:hypothetical protein